MTVTVGGVSPSESDKAALAAAFDLVRASEVGGLIDQVEAAADVATANARIYASTAAGIAATTSGQYFSVPSGSSTEHLILYLNNGGTAVEQKRYPTANQMLVGVSGAMTNVGYDTLTQRAVGSFLATAASGYKYTRQPLTVSLAAGQTLTVFYQADAGASAASPRVQLFQSGFGVVSNQAGLALDGQLRSVVLTATNTASELSFESNGAASAYGLRFVAVHGNLAETAPSRSGLISTIMSMMDLMSQPQKDLTLRTTGLVTGPSTNTSMDTFTVNGMCDLSFTEASGSISYARSVISTVTNGTKATLVYRVLPIDNTAPATGAVRAQLEKLGSGNASSTFTLVPDGLPRSITFAATQDANRILWDATTARLRVVFALLPGDPADSAAQSTGLQAALVALSQVMQSPVGGEYWTDDDKLIFWPAHAAFVSGRESVIYGRQLTKRRQRQYALDVSLISTAAESANDPGFSRYATPELRFNSSTLAGSACAIEVKDPAYPAQIRRKGFTRYLANASQTGTVLFTMLGDSTAALALNALKQRVNASGATFTGVGTLTSGGINYEGRAGWSALNYLGKSRPAANPFLRPLSVSVPADLAIITANPTICFADDASYGTGTRPSYAEDNTKASYSIFDWGYWRQNVAVNLTGTEKLRVCVQLGRNGTSSATFVADNELAHIRIVENFRTTFPNGTIFVSGEALGEATDTVNNMPAVSGYRDRTAPIIQAKIKNFDNRIGDRVWLVPAWAQQNAFAGFVLAAASSTDTDTGTTTHTVQDVVHYSGQTAIQWAEAMLGPLLYVHQTT